MDKAVLNKTQKVYEECGRNKTLAATTLGIARSTLDNRLKQAEGGGDGLLGIAKLKLLHRDEVAGLRRLLDQAIRESAQVERIRETAYKLTAHTPKAPKWIRGTQKTRSVDVAVLFLSDLHWGEVVNLPHNQYTLAIARQRLNRLIENALHVLKTHNSDPPDRLVLLLGGDMLGGEIHDELTQTNEATNLVVVFDLFENLIACINRLKEEFKTIDIYTTFGNHGRLTHKPRNKLAAETNLDWHLYQMLERHFLGNKAVQFHNTTHFDNPFTIGSTNYLLTHGDRMGVKGGDGVVGLVGPIVRGANKVASTYAARGQRIDTVVMGHFHNPLSLPNAIVNGSLKGDDEFGFSHRFATSEPQQWLWISNTKRGRVGMWPIFCE